MGLARWISARQKYGSKRGGNQHDDLTTAAAASNPDAVRFLEGVGCEMGERIANLVAFVDPELVIVSGEAIRFGAALTDAIRAGFERQFPLTKPELTMDWQSDYWTLDAAVLVVQGLFSQT